MVVVCTIEQPDRRSMAAAVSSGSDHMDNLYIYMYIIDLRIDAYRNCQLCVIAASGNVN